MTGVLIRRGEDTERPRRSHVKMEAEPERCGHMPRSAWSPQELQEAGRAPLRAPGGS